jgi:predicted RNA-binding Zn ribbon-like protein
VTLTAQVREDVDASELAFEFVSGAVSLDLVATVGERWRRKFERLRTPDDLSLWLHAAGLVDRHVQASERDLADARRLRAAIFDCIVALMGQRPHAPRAARAVLNEFALRGASVPQLAGAWTASRFAADPFSAACAELAHDFIDVLTSSAPDRFRECAAADCSHIYIDRSRPGLRRWCSARGCGNRAKTIAYRRRRKPTDTHRP